MNKLLWLLLAAAMAACGTKPKPIVDAGPEVDAGVDGGGLDAGRGKGIEPPTGYTTALPLPEGNGPSVRVGVSGSMALDQFNHPMIAAIYTDPNNDGNRIDDTLVFTRWNGLEKTADGGTLGYQLPHTIATIGEIDLAEPNRQLSLSRDPSSGAIGVAYLTDQKAVKLAISNDEGLTWSPETVSLPNPSGHLLGNPSLVLRDGVTHLAYFEAEVPCGTPDCGQVIYRRRVGKAAFTDSTSPAPAVPEVTLARPVGLGVDSDGNAGLAYFTGPAGAAAGAINLRFWRPAGTTTSKVADSGGVAIAIARPPSVSLSFNGTTAHLAYHLPSATSANAQLWYAAATDAAGTGFTTVEIPRNSGGIPTVYEGTAAFQAIALDSAGKIAIAANHVGPAVDQSCKGGPKLARSASGTTFVTCRPDTGSTPVFGFAGLWINAAFHKPDRVTLAFTYETNSNPTIKGGVVVFRQP